MIAEALEAQRGWSSDLRHLEMRPDYVLGKPRAGPMLDHLDMARSDALAPPWPDLILTCGRRPANAALWIKRQSGGHTRIVLVGKPSGCMSDFDLVIGSAETVLAPFANVLYTGLPLMRFGSDRLAAERDAWEKTLGRLPRPLVAFLIGGPTLPFTFDARVLRRLRARITGVLDAGGTPFLVGSRRTPPGFVQRLAAGLPDRLRVYEWDGSGAANPYGGLLALGDRFVVTGDSISMQVEVARLGKPLEIVPLSTGRLGSLDHARRSATAWLLQPPRNAGIAETARTALARGLYRLKLVPQTRHYPRFHRMLVARGLACWVGTATDDGRPAGPDHDDHTDDDMARIVARIDRLVGAAS